MTAQETAGHTAISWHSAIARKFDGTYKTNISFRERIMLWSWLIERHAGKKARALDLGCGSGIFTFHLAQTCKDVTAVDGSAAMLDICREKARAEGAANVTFVESDIATVGTAINGPFDLIVCSSVIEYLDDLDGALSTIGGLLASGGALIVSCPNRQSLFRKVEPILHRLTGRPRYYRFVRNVLTAQDLAAQLAARGLRVEETHFYGHTKVLSPLLRRLGLGRYSDNLFTIVARK